MTYNVFGGTVNLAQQQCALHTDKVINMSQIVML